MKRSLGAKALVYPAPVFVVGTYDQAGKPNVATASFGGMCSAEPPCVALSLRRATASYANILARKAFTLNIPSEELVKQTDYFGLVSGHSASKLSAAKLNSAKSKLVDAPYIKQFPLVLECRLIQAIDLGLHTQFIGEVLDAKAEEDILGADGSIDIKRLKPLVFTPDTQDYYGIGEFVGKVFSAGKDL